MRRLTLSTETLRVLDDSDLAGVVGGTLSGGGSRKDHKKGHGKTGQHGSCNARSKPSKPCRKKHH